MPNFQFSIYSLIWLSRPLAALSAFKFEADVAGWHLVADEQSIALTWPESGMTWHSPLPSVNVSKRAAGVSAGCWKHSTESTTWGGRAALSSGLPTNDGVKLEGTVMMPSGHSERWRLMLGVGEAGSLSFLVEVENRTGASLHAQRWCSLKDCYSYASLDVSFPWYLQEGEHLVGGGEQYSQFDLRGQQFSLWSGEQGIGRGRWPITEVMDGVTRYCGGDRYTSYSYVPAFLSTKGYGVVLNSNQLVEVNFQSNLAELTVVFESRDDPHGVGVRLGGHLLAGPGGVRALLPPLTAITGRMSPPPAWTSEGLVVGSEGGHEFVSSQLEKLIAANVSVVGVWIQDWSGMVDSIIVDHVWWNWELDETRYPKEWFKQWAARGVRVTTYASPYIAITGAAGRSPKLFEEGKRLGHLVTTDKGEIFIQKQPWGKVQGAADAAMVNLLDPDAFDWWAKILRCNVLMACEPDGGPPLVHGWMNDYGEWLPLDASVPLSNQSGITQPVATDLHNTFGRLSAAAASVASAGLNDTVFWSRSGDLKGPSVSKLFWTGDQITNWDACDGLQSVLIGTLSGGLSGWTITHSDIGGFDAIAIPIPGVRVSRTPELLVRWLELAVFTSALLRTHPSTLSNASAQPWHDAVLPHTRSLVDLFAGLAPYRSSLLQEAAQSGLPPVRHGLLVEPDDVTWFNASKKAIDRHCRAGNEVGLVQFFLGDEVIVAPVFEEGAETVDVYLSSGSWVHFWTGTHVTGPSRRKWQAPLGQPAFFFKAGPSAKWTSFFSALARKLAGSELGVGLNLV